VLASFHDRYETLTADHPDAKKEMALLGPTAVQIGQLVQNSPKVNGNGAKWIQLAERAEADRHTLCMFLDGRALFAGLFHMYAATFKEMRDNLKPIIKEYGQENFRKQNKINAERETDTLKMSAKPRK
jgi:hypothetical protein